MRKPRISILLFLTIVFAAFTLRFFWGRNQHRDGISVMLSEQFLTEPTLQTENNTQIPEETTAISFPISINQAGKEEIMALPGIGDVLAERIVVYRQEHGGFSSVEELLNVEGLGKKRLEEILDLIIIGG